MAHSANRGRLPKRQPARMEFSTDAPGGGSSPTHTEVVVAAEAEGDDVSFFSFREKEFLPTAEECAILRSVVAGPPRGGDAGAAENRRLLTSALARVPGRGLN